MELSLSGIEVRIIERLLREYQARQAGEADMEEREAVESLLHRLSHPMRGGLEQSDAALMTDVGESVRPPRS